MELVPQVSLNSGHKIPAIGMGTAASPVPPAEELISILITAMEAGYRHFDTASLYGTEEALGRAVAKALDTGLIESRDELFITSKLWCTDAHPDLVLPALKSTLGRLGVEYVDLYLVHWPVRLNPKIEGLRISKEDILPFDMKGTWEAMEECCRLGLTKSIGVSNFGNQKLLKLLENATIPPSVNQVEMNVGWQQQKLREFCKEKGIHVSAWSPLSANGASWGSLAVMDSPVLKDIASKRGKSVAQVALRWIQDQGASCIAKSFNKERMKNNLDIFDWKLSEEELGMIREQIPQRRAATGHFFVSPNGPYKSLEELWDGEP
ncbi:Methylecgonone reductase [Bertholletia excelsa]